MRTSSGKYVPLLLGTTALLLSACGKQATVVAPVAARAATDAPSLQFGETFKIASKILDEERTYWVHLPETYRPGRPSPSTYPVLYVLDAEIQFETAVATVDFLTGLAMIPEMIVVGVTSTEQRLRDMTPTHSTNGPHARFDPAMAASGGAERFERFLTSELIPQIESTYPTLPYRVLLGFSLSGLLSLHAAFQDSSPFQAVIAADPSLWWDDQTLVKEAARRFTKPIPRLKSIYVSTGALPLDNGEDASDARAALQAFSSILASSPPTLRAKVHTFEQENHQSVAFPSVHQGLLFTFDGYKMATSEALKDTSRIEAHYLDLSARYGVEWRPPQRVIDLVSYSLLFERKEVDAAIGLLERNAKAYPNSAAAHDHLARAYLVKGDKAAAIRCFERVLELDPKDGETRGELDKLRRAP